MRAESAAAVLGVPRPSCAPRLLLFVIRRTRPWVFRPVFAPPACVGPPALSRGVELEVRAHRAPRPSLERRERGDGL